MLQKYSISLKIRIIFSYYIISAMKVVNGVLLFLLVIMLWVHWFGTGGANDLREKQALYKQQLEKNQQLQARNAILRAEVQDLKVGLEAIEERARSEMGMVKSQEIFIQVIEDGVSQ
ncbi:Cell division protein DivIC (FtsB), stabilizes FtsL against RasP cleavage [hydrothermal vent metagenome]|uniref:Cell division protein DivIC (FtsB), stabilizes FtsL against RasP cleavage n=1 Tax=hydrothermal vent metagenome TaxID=652676 RepID=A0A3B0V821_9ZZZZ